MSQAQESPRILIEASSDVNPWNHLDVQNRPGTFQFAIVTDRTGGHRAGVFPDAIHKLNLLQPEFVMSVGDLIEGYTEDRAQITREWTEFEGFIDSLDMPFFYVPGNHDYLNPVMAEAWKQRFGKDYYHFVYQDVLFLCLNSEERMRGSGRGYIDTTQLAYIQQTLAENQDVKWTLVFVHQPLWDQKDPGEWPAVEEALRGRPHTVFAGHRHRYVKYERNQSRYFILATTGGSSSLRGPNFGEFDHVAWVTMTEQGPIIANLMLDGIWDEDVQTESMLAFSRPLLAKPGLRPAPLLVRQGAEMPKELTLRLQNDSDVPMAYEVKFHSSASMWLVTGPLRDTLGPNQTLVKAVPIQSGTAQETRSPVHLTGTLTYLPSDQPVLAVEHVYQLGVETVGKVLEKKGIVVDGDLQEWSDLPYKSQDGLVESDPFSHDSDQDASFSWDMAIDDQFLYMAANVQDDEVITSEGGYPWTQDAIGFMIDARAMSESAYNNGRGYFREWLPVMIMPGDETGVSPRVYNEEALPKGTQYACRRTSSGYQVEIAVPLAYVAERQGDDWAHLRFNVIQQDMDDEGMHQSRVLWQPDWQGEDRRTGAGMFQRD